MEHLTYTLYDMITYGEKMRKILTNLKFTSSCDHIVDYPLPRLQNRPPRGDVNVLRFSTIVLHPHISRST